MYTHILLPVDGSPQSHKAEKECIAFAKAVGARITVLHVVSHFQLGVQRWGAYKSIYQKIEKEHEDESKERARTMISDLETRARAAGVKCDSLIVVGGHPYEEIIDKAQAKKCDLIMMASHGHTGISAMLLGSETVKVLTHAKVPVLVVR